MARILIVDDDETIRAYVEAIMASKGWEAVTGTTGRDAVELAEQELPDLIILDVLMPVMDGFEAFKELRKNYLTKDIPVIMLTAVNQEGQACHDEVSMERELGVDRPEGFVNKPVDPDFLMNTIFGVVG